MQAGALRPYEDMLESALVLDGPVLLGKDPTAPIVGSPSQTMDMITAGGEVLALDLTRWIADADADDHGVIDRCLEPTLDIGCGPGRMVRGLYRRGISALGVDIAAAAVELSNRRGGPALLADVFGPIPGAGTWASILLLDGNVGIGGDVQRLLHRVAALLMPGGSVIVEVSPWQVVEDVISHSVRFRIDGVEIGGWFPWAVVDEAEVRTAARLAGLECRERWSAGARIFMRLAAL